MRGEKPWEGTKRKGRDFHQGWVIVGRGLKSVESWKLVWMKDAVVKVESMCTYVCKDWNGSEGKSQQL